MPDATFACPDLTKFCRLDELGLEVVGQRLEPECAVLACRVLEPDPGAGGHLLVVPKAHSRDLLDIAPADLAAVSLTAQRIATVVVGELGADGVTLLNCCGADAWQTVFHFHLHLVPRYTHDTRDRLTPPWTPGIAG